MVNPLTSSRYLDFTSYGMTTAPTVTEAYHLQGAITAGPTVNVALVLDRAQDPTALLTSDWATRQQTLSQLQTDGTLWSTYGASTSDYTAVMDTLAAMNIPVLGDATGSDGYVTSQESRTIWVQLTAQTFEALFDAPWVQQDELYFWEGGMSLPDGLPVKGLWFDTSPIWGTYPGVSNLAGDASVIPPQGWLSIGSSLQNTSKVVSNYAGDMAAWFYNFPLAGMNVPTATIGLLEPGIGDALPPGSTYTFQQGFDSFRQNTGQTTPGSYYVVANNGQNYTYGNPSERSLDLGVVISATPGSTIGLYVGSGFDGSIAQSNAYTAFQAAFWDQANNPPIVSSSYSIFQQSAPDSPFAFAVRQLFIDSALRNITMVNANNDWGSGWNLGNGLANQANNVSSPYLLSIGGTSISTVASAVLDETVALLPTEAESLYGQAMAGDMTALWRLIAGGLTVLPSTLAGAEAARATFLESVWNVYKMNGNRLEPQFGASDGGVDTSQSTPWYQTAFGLTPTSVNPGHRTGRGAPDVSANAGGNMLYAGPWAEMTPGPTPPGGYWGTSAATPMWASLIAQIDTVFEDQGLPNLGFANDLLYTAAAIAPASFNDITYGNNVLSFRADGPIENTMLGHVTLTGYGYDAGPGYDLTTGLGSPNGLLLARALSSIAHSQMYFDSSPDMLDADGPGWASGADQSLMFQSMSRTDATIDIGSGGSGFGFGSTSSDAFAWTSRLAQQVLQPDFDPNLVRLFDKQSQGWVGQSHVGAGESFTVDINGLAASAPQGTMSSTFGFADFVSGDSAVRVARPVAMAETAGGADDVTAVVRLRQNGEDSLSLTFYRVDDLAGRIGGLDPDDAGYAQAAQSRAYALTSGGTSLGGPGYGNYQQTGLLDVDAGDMIAMTLFNNDSGATFWAFAQANESFGGPPVGHLWNYGLNTWGWEDTWGGGDQDYNDFLVQLDFTSTSGSGWLV